MAKRFTDTGKWKKSSFTALSLKMKLVWFYLLDNCDHAGIWDVNWGLISYQINAEISATEVKEAFGDKLTWLSDTKIFIPNFVEFQYGELNPQNRAHQSVISRLKKEGAIKGLARSLQGRKDKDKELVKDKDKERVLNEIYALFPRKEGKTKAFKTLLSLPIDDFSLLKIAVKNYSLASRGNDPKFIKHFSTFANEWRDWVDYQPPKTTAPTGGWSV